MQAAAVCVRVWGGAQVRCGQPKKGPEAKKSYVHLLNSTLTATERTLCCVLENHQTADGFKVPEVLQPYMHGITFIPFVKVYDKTGKLVDVEPKAGGEASASDMSTGSTAA